MAKTFRLTLVAGEERRINAVWKNLYLNECKEVGSSIRKPLTAISQQDEISLEIGARYQVDDRENRIDICNENSVAVEVTITLSIGRYSNSLLENATAVSIIDTDPVNVEFVAPQEVKFPTPQNVQFATPQSVKELPADALGVAVDTNVAATTLGLAEVVPANAIGIILSLITSGTAHGDVRIGSTDEPPTASRGIPMPSDGSPVHLPVVDHIKIFNANLAPISYSAVWLNRS